MPQIDPTLGTIDPYLPSEIKPALYYYDEYQSYDLMILDKIDRRICQIANFNNTNSILYQLLKGDTEDNRVLIERFFPYQNYPYAHNYGLILLDKLKKYASSGWCEPYPLHTSNDPENNSFINQKGVISAIIHGSFLGYYNNEIIGKSDWINPDTLNPTTDWILDYLINNTDYIYIPSKEFFLSQGLDINSFYLSYLRYDITTEIPEYIWIVQKVIIKNEPYQFSLPEIQPWSLVFENNQISDIVKSVNFNFNPKIKLNWYDQIGTDLDQIVLWIDLKLPDIGKILSSIDISFNAGINPYSPSIENVLNNITFNFNQIDYPINKRYYAYIFANNSKDTNLINADIINGSLTFKDGELTFYNHQKFNTFIYENQNEIYPFPFGTNYYNIPLLNENVYNEIITNPTEYFEGFNSSPKINNFSTNQGKSGAQGQIINIPFLSSFLYEYSTELDKNTYPATPNTVYYNSFFTPNKLKINQNQYFNLFAPLWTIEPNFIIVAYTNYFDQDNVERNYLSDIYLVDRYLNILSEVNFVKTNGNIYPEIYSQETYTLEWTGTISRQLVDNYLPLIETNINDIINEIDQKYYNYYLDENNKIEFTNYMPDSLRIKEVHAALQADKFSKDDTDPSKARVANLGYYLERLARIWGISVNSDGSIRSIRQKRHIAVDDPTFADDNGNITIPAGWSFGQFSLNNGGSTEGQLGGNPTDERDGIVYEVRSNYFNSDQNPDKILEGGYLLCENWPQYLDSLLDDLDKAIGWQNAGANALPTPENDDLIKFEGLHQIIYEAIYMLSDLSKNIKETHVLSSEIQAEVKEIIGQFGLPVTIKSKDFDIEDDGKIVTGKLPYIGFNPTAPTLYQLITILLMNLSLINNSVLTPNLNEENI